MNENHGAATKLLYQLFIALGRKAKKNLTGVAMETMRPSAPVKLESIESSMHKEVRYWQYFSSSLGNLRSDYRFIYYTHFRTTIVLIY